MKLHLVGLMMTVFILESCSGRAPNENNSVENNCDKYYPAGTTPTYGQMQIPIYVQGQGSKTTFCPLSANQVNQAKYESSIREQVQTCKQESQCVGNQLVTFDHASCDPLSLGLVGCVCDDQSNLICDASSRLFGISTAPTPEYGTNCGPFYPLTKNMPYWYHPIDALDSTCMWHDYCYLFHGSNAEAGPCTCDMQLDLTVGFVDVCSSGNTTENFGGKPAQSSCNLAVSGQRAIFGSVVSLYDVGVSAYTGINNYISGPQTWLPRQCLSETGEQSYYAGSKTLMPCNYSDSDAGICNSISSQWGTALSSFGGYPRYEDEPPAFFSADWGSWPITGILGGNSPSTLQFTSSFSGSTNAALQINTTAQQFLFNNTDDKNPIPNQVEVKNAIKNSLIKAEADFNPGRSFWPTWLRFPAPPLCGVTAAGNRLDTSLNYQAGPYTPTTQCPLNQANSQYVEFSSSGPSSLQRSSGWTDIVRPVCYLANGKVDSCSSSSPCCVTQSEYDTCTKSIPGALTGRLVEADSSTNYANVIYCLVKKESEFCLSAPLDDPSWQAICSPVLDQGPDLSLLNNWAKNQKR